MSTDESFLTAELQARIGIESPPRPVEIAPETVRRLADVLGDAPLLPALGDSAPPTILLAMEASLALPETPAAPETLVTGDEWTFHRPLRVGERWLQRGRLAAVHERFGSRMGQQLNLHLTFTFTGEDGAVAAEIGRGMIRYRAPEAGVVPVGPPDEDGGIDGAGTERLRAGPHGLSIAGLGEVAEGHALPETVLRPTLGQAVRYCGLTWNFVPIFYDAAEARRAGLPGTIVPGPLKLALLTRYLAGVAGPGGVVRSVRIAHRRPDRTGRPLHVRGVVTRVETNGDGRRVVECEIWTENARGERSIAGSAALLLPPASG